MSYVTEINRIKKKLINKAKKRGIYENFGQKEFRQLMDKYGGNFTQDTELRYALMAFNNWAMNYDLRG